MMSHSQYYCKQYIAYLKGMHLTDKLSTIQNGHLYIKNTKLNSHNNMFLRLFLGNSQTRIYYMK